MADVYDDWFGVVSDWRGAGMRLRVGGPTAGRCWSWAWEPGGSRFPWPRRGGGVGLGRGRPPCSTGCGARPGGAAVRPVLGDMAELAVDAPGAFRLVYAIYNSFFNLTTEAAQRRCLERGTRCCPRRPSRAGSGRPVFGGSRRGGERMDHRDGPSRAVGLTAAPSHPDRGRPIRGHHRGWHPAAPLADPLPVTSPSSTPWLPTRASGCGALARLARTGV